jgi:hypothetical protein
VSLTATAFLSVRLKTRGFVVNPEVAGDKGFGDVTEFAGLTYSGTRTPLGLGWRPDRGRGSTKGLAGSTGVFSRLAAEGSSSPTAV